MTQKQCTVYRVIVTQSDMVKLQQRLVETWTEFQQSMIVYVVIEQWHNRLHSCLAQRKVTFNT